MTAPVRSTCPYCGVGCGVVLRQTPTGPEVKGDPEHPANFGRLCSKGSALAETVGLQGRLLYPKIHGAESDWDTALTLVADQFRRTIARHGPDAVAFYVSGQMLTEDYYVANKLMKGFIGSANIDTNSRLCMASSVAGHRRAFGSDTVPGLYEDLSLADLVVLVGSNLAWCHPVLYQRLAAAKAARPGLKVVVIDPRRTATSDLADLHLALKPGADVALFNALLAAIETKGALNSVFLAQVNGLEAALAVARIPDETGLCDSDLQTFIDLWTQTEKVVTVYSQGINQSSSGTDKVNAILNCHLATGRIGRPGMGPFSVTGQPNAMGGREVGGMANMLACHLEIENPSHRTAVQGFWNAPTIADKPGLKAVDMFRAVEEGRIKALWIIHTNPAVTMPDADRVARAIANCDFVVVSDIMADTDTTRLADVLLPAAAWGEKDGTVTNSERRISRQRAFRQPPGQARADWRIIAAVAQRMGFAEAFSWTAPAEVFEEYARLSGLAGSFGSDFDISNRAGTDYATMEPFLWPDGPQRQQSRFFGDGRFHHPDGKARMIAVAPEPQRVDPDLPYRLNTGRIRDQWHTMTRTGLAPRLTAHIAEPYLEVNPADANVLGLAPATLAEVTSPQGRAVLRVLISDRVAPGAPFAPIHWTGQTAPTGRVDALAPWVTDPVSGQPDSKAIPVSIQPFAVRWYGFAVAASDIQPDCAYFARSVTQTGIRAELAGIEDPADWQTTAKAWFALDGAEVIQSVDPARGIVRLALLQGGRVVALLFIAPDPVALSRGHVVAQIGGTPSLGLLAGVPSLGQPDSGTILCACFNVGVTTLTTAITSGACLTLDAIGAALRAGTNCGSCRPEIKALLARHTPKLLEAAE